jgi:hypothetical protein
MLCVEMRHIDKCLEPVRKGKERNGLAFVLMDV